MKILHSAMLNKFTSGLGIASQMYDELQSAKDSNIDYDVKIFSPMQNIPKKYKELFEFCGFEVSKHTAISWVKYRKLYYSWLKNKEEEVDCYILRYSTYDPFQYFFIKSVNKPVYLVHHTKELDELGLLGLKGKFMCYIDRLFGNKSIRHAAGIIGVTNELVEYEKSRINDFSKISIVYPNGIKMGKKIFNDRRSIDIPEILFVASYFYSWHGLDLLIADVENSDSDFLIHIVGNVSKKDAENLKKDKRFILHSNLNSEEISKLSEQCWIALGSFALYRKNLKEASTLKVREYLNNGLPVYSGHIDSFPKNFLFYKYDALNIQNILEFAHKVRVIDKEEVMNSSEEYISKEVLLNNLYKKLNENIFLGK
jgi:hypothetical protein